MIEVEDKKHPGHICRIGSSEDNDYVCDDHPNSLIHRKITRKCTKQFHIINYYQELVLNLVNNKIINIYPLIYFQELGLVQLMQ